MAIRSARPHAHAAGTTSSKTIRRQPAAEAPLAAGSEIPAGGGEITIY
jgi:hypothetical protein